MSESRQPSMAELMDALNSVKDGQTQDRAAVAELEAERESLVSGSAASTEPAGPAVIGPVADLNTPASGVKPDEPADPGVPVAPPPVEDPSARAREAQEKARADALRAELMPKSNHIKAIWREAQILADQFEARIGIDWMDKPGYRAQYESIIAIAEAERELAVQLVNKNTLNSDGLQFVKERADELITICDTEIEKLRTAAATPSVDEGAKPLSAKDKILKDAQDDARRRREAMTGEGEPPPEPMMRDRKSAQLELEKLRAAYLKAKRHYETFRGAIGFITTQMFQKKRMADAESKLTEAKSQYETKLQEYKAAHISQHVEQLINQTDEVVQEERDARQKNIFLNIQDQWKKFGLARGVASVALLGAGTYFGATDAITWRRGLAGGAAGFGMYDLWNAGMQFVREHLGALRDLKPEKIAKMKSLKEVGKYLAAFEIDAATKRPVAAAKDTEELAQARKGIALQDDIRYIKLLERWHELRAEQMEDEIDALCDDTDEQIREKARTIEKRFRFATAAVGVSLSAAVGTALGTGAIAAALGLGGEVYEKTKEAIQKTKNIEYLQKISKTAQETVTAAATEAAKDTQSSLAEAGVPADNITEAVEKATAEARKAAEEKWKNTIPERGPKYVPTEEGVAQAKQAAQTAGEEAAQKIVDAAKQEAAAAAEKAAREAAEAAKAAAGKGVESAASAADTTFKALPKEDQMKQIYQLAMAAQTNPEISNAALNDIAQERLANKEFKSLADAIKATKAEYLTRVATTHTETLSSLASQIGTQGKLTLGQFENLRNLASWHDTTAGEAARKLLLYVENPDNNVFETSKIETLEITKDKPLFEAFSEAEHKLGVADPAQIDKNFATFLEKYGVDALNAKNEINADVLAAAKKGIKHVGETLWYSSDGIIASQEIDMMSDELEPEPEQPVVQDKPAAQAKPEAKAPVADKAVKPVEVKPKINVPAATADATVSTLVEKPASGSIEMEFATAADTASLPKGWEWVANAESIKNLPVDQIKSNPEVFYRHVVEPLKGDYPGLGVELFNQEMITSLVRDPQHGTENIKQLFNAFIAEKKSIITLQLAGQEPATIEPRK